MNKGVLLKTRVKDGVRKEPGHSKSLNLVTSLVTSALLSLVARTVRMSTEVPVHLSTQVTALQPAPVSLTDG